MKDLILIYVNTSFFILHFPVWMQDEGVKEKCTENMVGLGQSFCCHFCLENYVRKMKFYISTKLYILKLYLFIGEGGREEGRKEGREGERREGGIDTEREITNLLVYSPNACNHWGWAVPLLEVP